MKLIADQRRHILRVLRTDCSVASITEAETALRRLTGIAEIMERLATADAAGNTPTPTLRRHRDEVWRALLNDDEDALDMALRG